jgi:hypothetical protein
MKDPKNATGSTPPQCFPPPKGIQWEIPLVDEYLYSLLVPSLQRAISTATKTSLTSSSPPWWLSPRFLMTILSTYSIYMTRGQTPAVQILGWNVVMKQQQHQRPSQSSVLFYILWSVMLPTLYQHARDWYQERFLFFNNTNVHANNHDNIHSPSSQQQQQQQQRVLALQRKRRVLQFLFTWCDKTIALARLLLWLSPWTCTCQLAMALVGWEYQQSPQQQQPPQDNGLGSSSWHLFHVTYGHRRWFYEELWRFCSMASPVGSWQEGHALMIWYVLLLLSSLTKC